MHRQESEVFVAKLAPKIKRRRLQPQLFFYRGPSDCQRIPVAKTVSLGACAYFAEIRAKARGVPLRICVPHVFSQMYLSFVWISLRDPMPSGHLGCAIMIHRIFAKAITSEFFQKPSCFFQLIKRSLSTENNSLWVCRNLDLFGEFMGCFSQQKYLYCYHVSETYCYLVLFCISSRIFQMVYPLPGFKLIADFPSSSRLAECLWVESRRRCSGEL